MEIGRRELVAAAVVDREHVRPDAGAELGHGHALHREADAVAQRLAVVQVDVIRVALEEQDRAVGELVGIVPEIGERRVATVLDLHPARHQRLDPRVRDHARHGFAEPALDLVVHDMIEAGCPVGHSQSAFRSRPDNTCQGPRVMDTRSYRLDKVADVRGGTGRMLDGSAGAPKTPVRAACVRAPPGLLLIRP